MSRRTAQRYALIDAFLDSYVRWREACEDVWNTYRSWAECQPQQRPLGFAAYQLALDREEHAAVIHCQWVERVSAA